MIVTSDKCYENREWPEGYREDEPMGGHDLYSHVARAAAELVVASLPPQLLLPGAARDATASRSRPRAPAT